MKACALGLVCVLGLFSCGQKKPESESSNIEKVFELAEKWAISKGAIVQNKETSYEWTLDTQQAIGHAGSVVFMDGFISDMWSSEDGVVALLDVTSFGLDHAEVQMSPEQFAALKGEATGWFFILLTVDSVTRVPEIAFEYWSESRSQNLFNTTGRRVLRGRLIDWRTEDDFD